MLKRFAVSSLATVCFTGSVAFAAQTDLIEPAFTTPALKTTVKNEKPEEKKKAKFEAVTELSGATITDNDSLQGGRVNVMEWNPKLMATFNEVTSFHANLPLYWASFPGASNERVIGRPEMGVSQIVNNDSTHLNFGINLRFPMADDSRGWTEGERLWGINPFYSAKMNLNHSRIYVLQTGGLSYNTAYDRNYYYSSGGQSSYQSNDHVDTPIVAILGAGAGFQLAKMSADLTLNFMNGIGVGHDHHLSADTFNGQTQTTDIVSDLEPADLSFLKLAAQFALSSNTKLNSFLSKSLKGTFNHGSTGISIEDLQSVAYLSVGVGITQSF